MEDRGFRNAKFSEDREIALSKQWKNSNRNIRILPEADKKETLRTAGGDHEAQEVDGPTDLNTEENFEHSDIDYDATSKAVLTTLRKIRGHVIFDEKEKNEAIMCIVGKKKMSAPFLSIIMLIIGSLLGFFVSRKCKN